MNDAPKKEIRNRRNRVPHLTVPQILSFVAVGILALLAVVSPNRTEILFLHVTVTKDEFDEIQKLTLFLVGALLPSDALIRYGRSLLFATVDDPDTSAKDAPSTTLAQVLAFAAFLIIVLLAVSASDVADTNEFAKVNEAVRVLIVALLPSDAGIRFGRALYVKNRSTATPDTIMKKI